MDRKTFKIIPSIPFNSFNSIQWTVKKIINIQITGLAKSTYNYREKSKSVITREYKITGKNQLLQFYILKAKSTISLLYFEGKINLRWRGAVDDEGWTTASEKERCRLLLLMKRKSSTVDDGKERRSLLACHCWWRLKRKPWAVEEIVADVDEKEVATMSTDD